MLPGGSYGVTAHYAGDGTYGASDSTPPVSVTVSPEGSQTRVALLAFDPTTGQETSSNATSVVYGSSWNILRMDVTNSSGQLCYSSSYACPTGQVALTDNGRALDLGTYKLNSQGYTEDQFPQLAGGSHNVAASYSGDNSYNVSASLTDAITVIKAPTTITGCTLPSTVQVGVQVSCLVTVSTQSHGVAPTGVVVFMLGSTPVTAGGDIVAADGSATSYASLQETLYPIFQQGGTFSLTEQYPGDEYYLSSTTSPAVTINISDFSVSPNPSTITIAAPGQSGTSLITLAPVAGFTGTVTLSCGPSDISIGCAISPSSVNLSGSSSATATLTVTTGGASSAIPPTLRRKAPLGFGLSVAWYWLLAGLVALVTLVTRVTGRRSQDWLFAAAVLVVGIWVACGGGGGGGSGPPPAPAVSLSPATLSFGNQVLGTVSAKQSVTVTNTGNAVLTNVGVYLLPAGETEFSAYNGCDSTPNIQPGANCSIQVMFAPTVAGPQSASLSVSDNAPGSPQTASLTGTGVLPPTSPGTYSIQLGAVSGPDYHYVNVPVTVQ
jgi:hypothetical protein